MKPTVTKAIVLSRINFGEADRILTLLTPDNGAISVIAKGVRKQKSKLAGGIELFSESDISYLKSRSEVYTLISTRLVKHYQKIAGDIDRTMLGYEALKLIKKATHEHAEPVHYELLNIFLKSLNKPKMPIEVCELWFYARYLWIEGRAPNLATDSNKKSLVADSAYTFNYDAMAFEPNPKGQYNAAHIKLMRIAMGKRPDTLNKVIAKQEKIDQTLGLIKSVINYSN